MLKFPPWNADVWFNCAAAAAMQQSHPLPTADKGVPDSRAEGKAFDWLIGQVLVDGVNVASGAIAPNGVLIDDEMIEALDDYRDIVLKIQGDRHFEDLIDLGFLVNGQTGRADCLVINEPAFTVDIVDAKYGHTYVDEFENLQLLIYAMGVYHRLQIDAKDEQKWVFNLSIFQPRVYGKGGTYRTWSVTACEVRMWRERIGLAITRGQREDATCSTGNHCTKCNARHTCTSYARDLYRGIGYVGDAVAMDLHGESLGVEYKLLKHFASVLKGRLSGIEQQVLAELTNGDRVAGVTVTVGTGRQRWKKETPVDEVMMMGDLMGVDLRKPQALCTPSQAVKKGIDPIVINEYSETPSTGNKLVEVTEKSMRKTFRGNK